MQLAALDDLKLARLAQKDPKTADQVLSRVQPRVWQVVRMARGRRREADELCQICLIEILESLHKFRGEGSLESWAGQVAYRVTMRHLKKKRRRETQEAPMTEEVGVSSANPEREVSRAAIWERLLQEMEKIPAPRRISLMLHLNDDYTVEQVAELTGVSVNTTKDRLRTAYNELRAIFARKPELKNAMLEVIYGA